MNEKGIPGEHLLDSLYQHPLCVVDRADRIEAVRHRFGRWLVSSVADEEALLLDSFARIPPYSYLSTFLVEALMDFLREAPAETSAAILLHQRDVSRGLLNLIHQYPLSGREDEPRIESPEAFEEVEQFWHPEYQRVVEHIYSPLIQVVLEILGRRESKRFSEGALGTRVEHLKRDPRLRGLTAGFSSTMRNAIAHGGIAFEPTGIVYEDRRATLRMVFADFVRHLDKLLVVCNSLASGLLLSITASPKLMHCPPSELLPALVALYLRGAASYGEFLPRRASVVVSLGSVERLNVVCEATNSPSSIHRFNSLWIGQLVAAFFPDLDTRLFISHCQGSRILNTVLVHVGGLRRALRENEYVEVVDEHRLWPYESRWLRKLHVAFAAWRLNYQRERGRLRRRVQHAKFLKVRMERAIGSGGHRKEVVAVLATDAPGEIEPCLDLLEALVWSYRIRPSWWRVRLIRVVAYTDDMPTRRLMDPASFREHLAWEAEWVRPNVSGISLSLREPHVTRGSLAVRFHCCCWPGHNSASSGGENGLLRSDFEDM